MAMTRPFSLAYKRKRLDRLSGADAISARQLSLEIGMRQQTLSRWLQEARSVALHQPALSSIVGDARQVLALNLPTWCRPACRWLVNLGVCGACWSAWNSPWNG